MFGSSPPRKYRVAPSPPATKVSTSKSPSPTKKKLSSNVADGSWSPWQFQRSFADMQKDDAAVSAAAIDEALVRTFAEGVPPCSLTRALDALIDATLEGRGTALRYAKSEAMRELHRGPWSKEEVRRFRYLPGEHPDFTSRTLQGLVDMALLAHARRVAQAISEAEQASKRTAQAEADGEERLEEAVRTCKDPNAEHLVRQAVRGHMNRASKEVVRLREALSILSAEAKAAQSTSVTAMRCLAARLVAQHDANVEMALSELESAESELALRRSCHAATQATLLTELHAAELGGARSICGLEEALLRTCNSHATEMQRLKDEHSGAMHKMRARLEATEHALTAERKARIAETRLMRREMAAEVRGLEARCERSALERECVAAELAEAEEAGWSQGRLLRIAMTQLDQRGIALQGSEELNAELKATGAYRLDELARLKQATDAERRVLLERVRLLEGQVAALRASRSTRRSVLYWAGVANKGSVATHEAMEAFGLSDPNLWHEPASPPSGR